MDAVASRCNGLGDVVVSLPAVNLLQRAGFRVTFHTAAYARDIGLWGLANGLYEQLWIAGEPPPPNLGRDTWGLALHHSEDTVAAFRALRLKHRFGRYSKVPTFFFYNGGLFQRRSRSLKSEMTYNLELTRAMIARAGATAPAFEGLPALKLPPGWTAPRPSPDWVVSLSSGGSAQNWPVGRYLDWLARHRKPGSTLDFLVHGVDAAERLQALRASGILSEPGVGLVERFDGIKELIAYLSGAGQVLSSSSGPLHIAHAAGVPVYGIYPDLPVVESFRRWKPDGYAHGAPVTLIPLME